MPSSFSSNGRLYDRETLRLLGACGLGANDTLYCQIWCRYTVDDVLEA